MAPEPAPVPGLDLAAEVPAALRAEPTLYFLGVGGPEEASGIGRVETFVWRFAVLHGVGGSEADVALAFRSMPGLMAFTRTLNGRQPFTVPTEAMKVAGTALAPCPARVWLDPRPEDFDALAAAGGRLEERRIPALEGGAA